MVCTEEGLVGVHDLYGKSLLASLFGDRFVYRGESLKIDYGGFTARIDGSIDNEVAVEIESRTDKQIRAALLDLMYHPYPKKFLIVIPAHMNNPRNTTMACAKILNTLTKYPQQARVVLLQGTGHHRSDDADTGLIERALGDMDIVPS